MKVKLLKLQSTHNNLRTNEIDGECIDLPEIGQSFILLGEALNPDAKVRAIRTTPVQELKKEGNVMTFKTLNSIYELFIKEDV